MTPAKRDHPSADGRTGTGSPVLSSLETLKKRSDFLAAASARSQGAKPFHLQARDRGDDNAQIRVGFTCSKKVGNAVARNRAKRRLREVARLVLPQKGRPGWDYVLIGKSQITATRPFDQLLEEFSVALDKIHA